MKVLVSGGTGFIGKALVKKLRNLDHEVRVLQRESDAYQYYWNVKENYIDPEAFHEIDAIIHLAGAPISEPWTNYYKKVLHDSRIKTANLLFDKAKEFGVNLKVFVSASGVSIYGNSDSDKRLREDDDFGTDFLSRLTVDWEAAADQFSELNVRVVKLRTPVVLDKKGGAFEKMKIPFKFGLGMNIGKGNNYLPWIHLEDLLNIYVTALENETYQGAINAVADEQVMQNEMNMLIAKALNKPYFLPNVPSIIVKKVLGERSDLILNSVMLSNMKLKTLGYQFQYSRLKDALNEIVKS